MTVHLVKSTDAEFAESLAKKNMAQYYQARGIVWESKQFSRSWSEFDNYELLFNDIRVGIARLSYDKSLTILRDFQILSKYQGQGIGSKGLDLVINHAIQHHSEKLRLRVFRENPAIKLYLRKGFLLLPESNGLIEMELIL
ncbi:MAG: GNAT family N-acetyltransferase [Shewanella sp.]